MNLFDFGHSLITGEWKLHRERVREDRRFHKATASRRDLLLAGRRMDEERRMRLYAGAEPSVARPSPNQLSTPEDFRQAYERIVLIRAARELEEDQGFFDGLLDDFEQYVAGEQVVWMPNTGNNEANAKIRDYLEWQFDQCDYSKRLDLTKIAQLFMRSCERDGECGVIPVDVGDSIKLRYYSGDCIGNPLIGANIGPNNYNGIRTNPEDDAPEFYDLFKRLPKMNAYVFDRSVPAHEFWHFYDPFRLQQYHGVSAFKNAIRDGFDIDQILEFTKLNIKWRSSQLPTVHTETGRPRGAQFGYFPGNGAPAGVPVNANGVPTAQSVNVDGVVSNFMFLDDKVMEYPNDFPNTQLQVSIEEFRRQCCKGVKIPYEFAYRADSGGVVQRFWVDKAMKTFGKKKHLLKRLLLNRYKNRAIQKGIDTGELDLDSFGTLTTDLARFKGQWQLGPQSSVDYGRETDADIKLIEAGLMSPQDKAANDNRNLDEISQEIEDHTTRIFEMASRIAKKVGQPIDVVLPFLVKKYPNAPANTPAAQDANRPDEPTTAKDKELVEVP